MSSRTARSRPKLPPVDQLLVAPGSGFEILDGKVHEVAPAEEPHALLNSKLAAILEAHVTADFYVAVDLLTRTDRLSNFAPDASVYPAARDPETGGRQLEHLAFEIVSTESMSHATSKAAKLRARGVRRIFALDVERQRVLEWSPRKKSWRELRPAARLADPCFALPLPVEALCSAARADDVVAAALLAKGNPVLMSALREAKAREAAKGMLRGRTEGVLEGFARGQVEGEARGRAEGEVEGRARALLLVLEGRGLPVTQEQREQIRACADLTLLEGWLVAALTTTSVAELLAPSGKPRRPRR
jgi:Uma2 family endonuclease